ncbi:serine/threonine-protein kinase [Streptomyces sp. NBC_00102]|uniref:serine/threonine-protein kinase n=1 Tax=Streptomyces sp. NBC_00102 TaxID=2975652 RepID=UPI002257DD03|nr:serine/threonine-protein kinase [Streptomyces sp. NBC_00102]MCX5401627.1 serine/threonine protein kinase [Streptomyces sp. NBC_00102]
MGEVWRATDEVLGRAVAVKLLLGDRADSSSTARFRLEAQTAARLSHPHLVAVFDFGTWEDRLYLVMELVEGRSLGDLLSAQESVHPEQVARIAGDAAAGLAAAHRQGVVHRDIKPGNLMLDAEGSVKIGDFGIAQFVDDPSTALTTAGQIVGTSLYLAPERALGRTAGADSDMYSLGCVVYHLLLGRPPFRSDTAAATLYQHVDTPPVPLRDQGVDISPAFDAYLLSLLAKKPEERPTAQEAADWFRTAAWRGNGGPLGAVGGGARSAAPTVVSGDAGGPGHRTGQSGGRRRAAPPANRAAPRSGSRAAGRGAPKSGSRRLAASEAIRRRPRVASAVAGSIAFVVAVYLGTVIFAPDSGSAVPPGTGASQGVVTPQGEGSPAPAASDARGGGQRDSGGEDQGGNEDGDGDDD